MGISPAQGYQTALALAGRHIEAASRGIIASVAVEGPAAEAAIAGVASDARKGAAYLELARAMGTSTVGTAPVRRLDDIMTAREQVTDAVAQLTKPGGGGDVDEASDLLYGSRGLVDEARTAPAQAFTAGAYEPKALWGTIGPKTLDAPDAADIGLTAAERQAVLDGLHGDAQAADPARLNDISGTLKYGKSLSAAARSGALGPVVGREAEIEQLIEILAADGAKNNAVLLGKGGVGKSALVEGLAQRIAEGSVPASLRDAEVVSIDAPSLVAGAKYVGVSEGNVKEAFDPVIASNGRVIAFVDEVHQMMGLGQGSNSNTGAENILKPAMARPNFRMVGATTDDEWSIIAGDPAFARRFQEVHLDPPTPEQTVDILRVLAPRWEATNHVKIQPDAYVAAARLTEQHLPDRNLPDKAIDALQRAATHVGMSKGARPERLGELDGELASLRVERDSLGATPDAGRLAEVDGKLQVAQDEYATVFNQWKADTRTMSSRDATATRITDTEAVATQLEADGNAAGAAAVRSKELPRLQARLADHDTAIDEIRTNRPEFLKETVDAGDVQKQVERMAAGARRRAEEAATKDAGSADQRQQMRDMMKKNPELRKAVEGNPELAKRFGAQPNDLAS